VIKKPKDMMAVPNASGVSGRKGREEKGYVNPELLIADLSKPHMFRMVTYAFLIHIAIILLTSIGFITLCVKYHSMHPRQVIKVLEKEAAEKKMKEDAVKATEDAMKAAKTATDEAKNAKTVAAPANTAAPVAAAATGEQPDKPTAAAPAAQPVEKKKSKIEQEVEKTSSERPTKPSVGLDMTPDLE